MKLEEILSEKSTNLSINSSLNADVSKINSSFEVIDSKS